ncbi:MAG: AtpZ/AtpI family protein [Ardenticatenaceae bacterium]|nr:AtpZ/AtpI family protein [Ardenticatenaceae bacterium]
MNQDPKQANLAALMATVVGQVGCLVVIIIGLALGAGMLLDRFLGTRAIFTVILMVGSVPVALYLTVRMSLTAVARTQQAIDDKKAEEETET